MTRSWKDNNLLREGVARTRRSHAEMVPIYEEAQNKRLAKRCAEDFFYRAYGYLRKVRLDDIDIISCKWEDEEKRWPIEELVFHASEYLGRDKETGEGMWIGRTFTTATDPDDPKKLTILDYTDEDGDEPFRYRVSD